MDISQRVGGTDYIWNDDKAAANQRKHGVRLEDALAVFEDPLFRLVDASRTSEARQAAIGFDLATRLLFVVHVAIADEVIRIISARLASAAEEAFYAQ